MVCTSTVRVGVLSRVCRDVQKFAKTTKKILALNLRRCLWIFYIAFNSFSFVVFFLFTFLPQYGVDGCCDRGSHSICMDGIDIVNSSSTRRGITDRMLVKYRPRWEHVRRGTSPLISDTWFRTVSIVLGVVFNGTWASHKCYVVRFLSLLQTSFESARTCSTSQSITSRIVLHRTSASCRLDRWPVRVPPVYYGGWTTTDGRCCSQSGKDPADIIASILMPPAPDLTTAILTMLPANPTTAIIRPSRRT